MKLVLLASTALLAGCICPPPLVIKEPVEVKVPVPVACLDAPLPKPEWELDKPAPAGMFGKTTAVLRELEQRRNYEREMEAAIQACIKK